MKIHTSQVVLLEDEGIIKKYVHIIRFMFSLDVLLQSPWKKVHFWPLKEEDLQA